jgi:hypothetical protein
MIKELMRNDLLNSIKMAQLDGIALKNKCELFLPPFQNRHNPFYVISKKEPCKLRKVLKDIDDGGFAYQNQTIKNNIYIEILGL